MRGYFGVIIFEFIVVFKIFGVFKLLKEKLKLEVWLDLGLDGVFGCVLFWFWKVNLEEYFVLVGKFISFFGLCLNFWDKDVLER